jgi:fatty acid desaturase
MSPFPSHLLPLPPHQVDAEFQVDSVLHCGLRALASHAVLIACWAALVRGWISPAVFVLVGLCAFVRNFNALHRLSHTHGLTHSWLYSLHPLLNIVASPLQLSYPQALHVHLRHHAHPRDTEHDPSAWLNNGPWWLALLNSLTQPEQSLWRWSRRRGLSWHTVRMILWHVAVLGAMSWWGGLAPLLWWLGLTRGGTLAAWFIFDWVLHHERLWGRLRPAPLPAPLLPLWRLLFGGDNLEGIRHHTLHHFYPFVSDLELPRLSALAQASQAPPSTPRPR